MSNDAAILAVYGTPLRRIHLHYRRDTDPERVWKAFQSEGEPLKRSRKVYVRRVGPWVVKEKAARPLVSAVRTLLGRKSGKRGWEAALALEAHGVGVPRPVAYAEWRWLGIPYRWAMVMAYLDGRKSVEDFAQEMGGSQAAAEDVRAYLDRLAQAVNALVNAGAYHPDLSGKNIFTRDGHSFHFIDLDEITMGKPYTREQRLKNHVQLYDSFCDWWDEAYLGPFIKQMLQAGNDRHGISNNDVSPEAWLAEVQAGQAKRRARIEAIWRREGKLDGCT